MPLILLRHTEPSECAGLCYGRADVPLRPNFGADAAKIEAGLPAVATIATSPSSRCRKLAEWIGARRGLGVEEDARLAEMDFGAWEARPWDAIPRPEIDAWADDFLGARPHGGESVAMLIERVAAALAHWRRAPGPVLLVSHSGVAKAARALAGEGAAWSSSLGYGEWIPV